MENIREWWIDFVGVKMTELTEVEMEMLDPIRVKVEALMKKKVVSEKEFNEIYRVLDGIETTEKYSRKDTDADTEILDYTIQHEVQKAVSNYQKTRKRMMKDNAGDLVRKKREEKNLTLSMTSSLTGISASYISKIETNDRKIPSLEVINGLSELLEIDMGELVNYIEDTNDKYVNKPEVDLDNILYYNKIAGVKDSDKAGLADLILEIINLEWSDASKVLDSATLINAIDTYKHKKI